MKYQNSPFGLLSGKMGDTVASSIYNTKYIKYAPVSVRQNLTPPLIRAREFFGNMSRAAKGLAQALLLGFASQPLSMSRRNYFIKLNKLAYQDSGVSTRDIDWDNVKISDGDLWSPEVENAAATGQNVTIEWNANLVGNAAADDKVVIVAYNVTEGIILQLEDDALRSAGTATLAIPAGFAPASLRYFLFASAADGSRQSISQTFEL